MSAYMLCIDYPHFVSADSDVFRRSLRVFRRIFDDCPVMPWCKESGMP